MKKLIAMTIVSALMIACGEDGTEKSTPDVDAIINQENELNSDDDIINADACPESNKFCHEHDGLHWSDRSATKMTWDEAKTYCANLGGRLPNISELRTIIINCPGTETNGSCKVSDPDCLSWDNCWNSEDCYDDCNAKSYSSLDDGNVYLWSSSEVSSGTGLAFWVCFYDASLGSSAKYTDFYVRCLR